MTPTETMMPVMPASESASPDVRDSRATTLQIRAPDTTTPPMTTMPRTR